MFGDFKKRRIAVAVLALAAASSQAAFVDKPLPSNTYIHFNGLDWAWAGPVAGDGTYKPAPNEPQTGFTGIDLSYQSQFGWRFATAEELSHAPTAIDFIFDGANVPPPGQGADPVSGALNYFSLNFSPDVPRPGPMACATPYFSDWAYTCNWQNGPVPETVLQGPGGSRAGASFPKRWSCAPSHRCRSLKPG